MSFIQHLDTKRLVRDDLILEQSDWCDHRVYSNADLPFLDAAIAKVARKWPSAYRFHECDQCWGFRRAIAIRFSIGWGRSENQIIYTGAGCGDVNRVVHRIDSIVLALREQGVDAFALWVLDRSGAR